MTTFPNNVLQQHSPTPNFDPKTIQQNVPQKMFYLKGYAPCRRPLLAPRGCHLGGLVLPFWQPGGPFWHLGSTLGDHRSSRMDMWGSSIRFFLIWGRFRDPIPTVCLAPMVQFLFFCLSSLPGHFLCRFSNRSRYAWGVFKTTFSH